MEYFSGFFFYYICYLTYKRDANFCMLSLYPAALLILPAFRVSVFSESLESLIYRIT